jgi:hypothetical protein
VTKQYRLPLIAMVETMKSSPTCVLLQAQLASLPEISKQACVAHVLVGQGILHTCRIVGATGNLLLHQRAAYEALIRYGDVDWLVLPAPFYTVGQSNGRSVTKALGSTANPIDTGNVPTLRVSPLPREILDQVPRGLRIALVLVDGKRSIAEIAQVLRKTPHEIQHIFVQVPHLVKLER